MAKRKAQKKATTLTAEEAAKLVKAHEDDCLNLEHITELDVGAAEALSKSKWELLYLTGLQTISDKAAKALA